MITGITTVVVAECETRQVRRAAAGLTLGSQDYYLVAQDGVHLGL